MSTRDRGGPRPPRVTAGPAKLSAAEELYRALTVAAKARLDRVIASGDDTAFEAAMERFNKEVDEAVSRRILDIKGGDMPGQTSFTTIITDYTDRAMSAAAKLRELEGRKDEMVLLAYQREHARLVWEVGAADSSARKAVGDYVRESYEHADDLRAQREADRDPAARTADIVERQALTADASVSAEKLMDDATRALNAERPERAAMLLSVAASKRTSEPGSTMKLATLQAATEKALNEAVPELARAAAIEVEVLANVAGFEQARYGTLVRAGLGVSEDDGVGSGSPSEVAAASSRLKIAAKASAERNGVEYVEPDGALPGVATGVARNGPGSLPDPGFDKSALPTH